MKPLFLLLLLTLNLCAQSQPATGASATADSSPFTITARGPHSRIWQQVTARTNSLGQSISHTNSYTELATGLQVWNGTAWAEASDHIQLTPNGAAGTNTQHQVSFAGNLNTSGAISLTRADAYKIVGQTKSEV